MIKKLLAALLVISLSACERTQQKVPGCNTGPCTLSFALIGVDFTDKDGSAVTVQNFTAINQRTKQSVLPATTNSLVPEGRYIITDDSMKDKLSTDGDEILVSAKYAATGQVKTATFKISGGCSCHVEKISGPQNIAFD